MKKTKTLKNPKGTKVTREVEVTLDDPTHIKLSTELGDKLKSLTTLRTDFADVKKKWNDRITPIADRVKSIENFLENGKEKKTVECVMVKNFDDNKIEYWFEGKIVDHRPMNTVDRQEDMPLKTKRGRTKENSVVKPVPTEDEEISNVRKLETGKRTKHSAVDGPVGNGVQVP